MEFKKIVTNWKTDLAECSPSSMAADISALEHWATVFEDPTSLAESIGKHLIFNKAAAETDIKAIKSDWDNQMWYPAGMALADLITIAIGPIQSDG